MTGRCLGARVADLVDGRLSPAETERAYAHVAGCLPCRAAVEAQRSVSGALGDVASSGPSALPPGLAERLRGIPELAADRGLDRDVPAIPLQGVAGSRPVGPAGVGPRSALGSRRPGTTRRGGRLVLAGAAGAAALAVVAAIGGSSALSAIVTPARPTIAPVVDRLTLAHVATADQLPFAGPRYETVAYVDPDPSGSTSPTP